MNVVKTRVVTADQKPFTPDMYEAGKTLFDAQDHLITFVEKGTGGGKLSVSFYLKTLDGQLVFHEMTQGNFEALIAIFNGAKARFGV